MKIAPGTFDGQSCMAKDVRMRLEEQGHWAGDDTDHSPSGRGEVVKNSQGSQHINKKTQDNGPSSMG